MIKIIGPRDKKEPGTINTTSHSAADWSRGLSPFTLGPIGLYGSHTARIFENAWQFAKLYPEHADTNGYPTDEYWTWAQNGWDSIMAFRYPAGKGRKPLCSLWNGNRLGYIEARKQIYIPLYQNAVKQTTAYQKLEHLYLEQGHLTLFDFDGYDHRQLGMSFSDVINCQTRICGHAFVLAIMLSYGSDFQIDQLPSVDQISKTPSRPTTYPIKIVNRKTSVAKVSTLVGLCLDSPDLRLRTNTKYVPHGRFTREESVLNLYRKWLWKKYRTEGAAYSELLRLSRTLQAKELILSCWCAPRTMPWHAS